MKPRDYLEISKKVKMSVYDTDGNKYKMHITTINRPTEQELINICNGSGDDQTIEFTNEGIIPLGGFPKEVQLTSIKVKYKGELIHFSLLPDLTVNSLVQVSVRVRLRLNRYGKLVHATVN